MGVLDIIKTVAGPVTSLLGIGSDAAQGAADRNAAQQRFNQQQGWQRELATKGVQYRIDDTVAAAKKHEFHPYALMGQQGYQAPSIYTGGPQSSNFAGSGQNLGKSIERALDPTGRKHRALQNQLLQAQIDNVNARTAAITPPDLAPNADPRIVDETQGGTPQGKVHIPPVGSSPGEWADAVGAGQYEVTPPKVSTHKKGDHAIRSGENPAYQEFILPGNFPIQLPGTEEGSYSEALEAIPKWKWPEILGYNSDFYGDGWFLDWLNFTTMGNTTKKKYRRAKGGPPRNKRKEIREEMYKFR